MKKILLLGAALLAAMTASAVTFNVTVPEGTAVCYVAGAPGWSHVQMEKVSDTQFTLTTDELNGTAYKYCAGDDWPYVEMQADGVTDVQDRAHQESDVVEAWKATQDPGVINTAPVYIRGSISGTDWPAIEELALQTTDGEYYVIEFAEPKELTGEFKIADGDWGSMNFGGETEGVVVNANEAVVLKKGGDSQNLTFAEGIMATKVEFTKSTATLLITTGATTAIDEVDAEDAVVAAFDITGKPVAADAAGIVILQYASGKAVKVFNN
jgi:hypothetical protein